MRRCSKKSLRCDLSALSVLNEKRLRHVCVREIVLFPLFFLVSLEIGCMRKLCSGCVCDEDRDLVYILVNGFGVRE